jgi:metal-sulfur cluster biosynthetic enzyme
MTIDKEQIIANLREVYDPEISTNVYDLGLIYDISIDEKESSVNITATLTSAFCPFADQIIESIQRAGYTKDGNVLSVNVDITFTPPFTMDSVPQETKDIMGW